MLGVTANRVFLFDTTKALPSIFFGLSIRQQSLDVVQLHKGLLEDVLGISEESIRNQQNLRYVRDASRSDGRGTGSARQRRLPDESVRMEQVRDIAFASEVLPQKSTDFSPSCSVA